MGTWIRLNPIGLLALNVICTGITAKAMTIVFTPDRGLDPSSPLLLLTTGNETATLDSNSDCELFVITPQGSLDPAFRFIEATWAAINWIDAADDLGGVRAVGQGPRKLTEEEKLTALLEGGGKTHEYVFTFQASKGKLTGTVAAPNGAMPISDGRIDGDRISFSMVLLDGSRTTATGVISGNDLKLSGQAAGRPFGLTAKRVAGAAGPPPGILKFTWSNPQ